MQARQAMGARHSSRPSLAAAKWGLVLGVLLGAAAFFDTAEASSFVVRVALGRSLNKVAARYELKGFLIKRRNYKHRFLVVATRADAESPPLRVSPPEPGQATATYPGTGSRSPAQQPQDSSLSPGGEEPWLAPVGTAAASAQSVGPVPLAPLFTRENWGQPGGSAVSIAAASDAQTLQFIGGSDIVNVQLNPQAYLVGMRPLPAAQRRRMLRQQQRQLQAASVRPAGSCPLSSALPDKDAQFGNVSEVVPYGVDMVEAVQPEMIEISKRFRSKVLYCVIDSGLDTSNAEFRRDSSSGCIANGTRANGTPYLCRTSYNLTASNSVGQHGTHVSGSVAAARNGRGVVGVSAEGGLLYHYNVFGFQGTFDYADVILAWDDCIAELDHQKVATNTPDMKMVVSMSFSSDGDMDVVAEYLKKVTAQRPDILWVAAAGNDNNAAPNYPAMSPEVVSVAAVDWNGNKAAFSNFGPTVEWAAPGVNTLSALPMRSSNALYTDLSVTLTPFSAPADAPDVLTNPRVNLMGGSGLGRTTAKMVDCGLGGSRCANATGKVCLLQRGGDLLFCTKVANCLAGGGIAAVVYGRDDQPECEQITAVTLVSDSCTTPVGGWPIVLAATRKQGLFLKNVIAAQPDVSITLSTGASDYSLGVMSGTSMATPTAAAVAGLVWSAHTECTAAQLRAAISKTAQDRGAAGRDDVFGHGIVKALRAHKHLLSNPCPGAGNSSDCVGNWTQWDACQDGVQTSTFVVASPAVGSGKACEAADSAVRNRTCSAGVSALPDLVTAESGVWTSVDAIVSNDIGAIIDVSFPKLRSPKKGILRILRPPQQGTQKTTLLTNVVLQYLSAPGFVGNDTFGYTVSDAFGSNSTAFVDVTVTPFTCQKSSCLAGGSCTGTGCTCPPGTGLLPAWIANSDRLNRRVIPRVPACRFRAFTPAAPLTLKGNQATANSIVALEYSVLPSAVEPRCYARSPSPVSTVTFEAQAEAQCLGITDRLVAVSGAGTATSSCTSGIYRHAVKVPDTPGCYIMRVAMIDTRRLTSTYASSRQGEISSCSTLDVIFVVGLLPQPKRHT
ncbi:peptidase S8/S53 domain-containing protein [Scenedesmus sp. NREL 46B-D3]|nr:peptidase S8/S53 domain-containing protein [Scenedesmus sp. NREL 46B-D3]